LLIIFSISYFLMSYTTKSILKKNSKIISHQSNQMIKVIQEGLGGIRDVLINGHQTFYSESYRAADSKFRNAGAINKFIISSPRFIMETIGMLVISILAYLITKSNDGIMNAVPVLGAMAIGAQKLLPALQQVYSSVTNMKSAKSSFLDVIDLLNQEIKSEENGIKKIEFRKYIEIKNVSFQYPSAKQEILKNLNLEIFKGDKVGIVGSTGSGKTTLLDIIMGLLIPSFGDIFIDGFKLTSNNRVNWQKNLSHVPQEVYLSDVSIAENIALGFKKNEIDLKQIMKVCEAAGVNSFISDLPNSYETLVGEKGVKLSGGQKQRIGIARALYRKSDILLLDEATSALDVRTEKDVMEKIQNLDKNLTIIMIAHRISTLRNCDYILEVNQGKIHKRLYDEIA